jgi:hypothetical protein
MPIVATSTPTPINQTNPEVGRQRDPLTAKWLEAMSVCVLLSKTGCTLLGAHAHSGIPAVIVDSRPRVPGLRDVMSLASNHCGQQSYAGRIGNVQVLWDEPDNDTAAFTARIRSGIEQLFDGRQLTSVGAECGLALTELS